MGEQRKRFWMIGAGTASVMAAAITAAAVLGPQTQTAAPTVRLTAAGTCDDLTSTLRTQLVAAYDRQVDSYERNRPPWWERVLTGSGGDTATAPGAAGGAAGGPAAAERSAKPPVPGTDYSTTNNQEVGVDEGDVVKTDGRSIVSVHGPGAVTYGPPSSRNATLRVTGTQPLAASGSLDLGPMNGADLFLDGDTVTVIGGVGGQVRERTPATGGGASGAASPSVSRVPPTSNTSTRVLVVNIADRAAPKVVRSMTFDGRAEATRSVQGRVRMVLVSSPPVYASPYGDAEKGRQVLQSTKAEDWLPMYRVDGPNATPQPLSTCAQTLVGNDIAPQTRPTSVVTIDPRSDKPLGSATVLNGASVVYATTDRVYLAGSTSTPDGDQTTLIDAIGVNPDGKVTPLAQGRVPGLLKDQFNLSEHNGHLRVASSLRERSSDRSNVFPSDSRVPATDNLVTVLSARDLSQVGQVAGLGKPGEQIKGVRFLGDQGYVVTFRQTDPLYVLDLRDPRRPAVRGELSIPGYSAYLHPIGDGRLVGVGADADANGRVRGTKVSLYDVADPSRPAELSTVVYPSQRSQAEFDHHAFLWWPKTGYVVIPLSGRMAAVKVEGNMLVEAGTITQPGRGSYNSPRRSLVIGDQLYAVSDDGISANALPTFKQTAWLPFG